MEFNADRMQYLAGVTGLDDYRTAVLKESKNINELDITLALEPADETEAAAVEELVGDLEVEVDVEEPLATVETAPAEEEEVEVEKEETVAEARLRRAIRKEIQAVLGEANVDRDERQFKQARRDKSVAAAMGWSNWASGKVHSPRKNRMAARGAGGTCGFGGPGFM